MKKIIISKEVLIQKYIIERKTVKEVAKELNCSTCPILRRMEEYGILRRDIHTNQLFEKSQYYNILSKEVLAQLYIVEEKNIHQIAKIYHCNDTTVRRYLLYYNIPFRDRSLIMQKIRKKGTSLKELGHKDDCQCAFCRDHHGKNNNNYKGGISTLYGLIKVLDEYKIWRKSIFQRDNYTCQDCGQVGGEIHSHHKKLFYIILREFLQEYNQFSPIEEKEILVRLAITYSPFWDIDNGITLCKECHKKVGHKWAKT